MSNVTEACFWTTIPDNGGKPIFHRQMRLFGISLPTSAPAAYNQPHESPDSVEVNFARRDVMSMIGKTLAHYEITSQLGKGGMGEVYQSRDQKLGRDVAIKVLPEEFAKDADRVARFQREDCGAVPKIGRIPKELFRGVNAQYLPTGHIVYRSADNSDLLALPFNPDRLDVTGGPVAVLEGVRQYAVSKSGNPGLYTCNIGQPQRWTNPRLGEYEREKKNPFQPAGFIYAFQNLPDGNRVALTVRIQYEAQNLDLGVWFVKP